MIEHAVGFDIELIPDEDNVFRNVLTMKLKEWPSDRRPNEADFSLRAGEKGLSVNWEKYCDLENVFVLLGLQKLKDGIRNRNPKDFRTLRLNVGAVRAIKLISNEKIDVLHHPEISNRSHSEICCDDNDELRLKLCDLVESNENALLTPNFENVDIKIKEIQDTLANN